jgi:hypothetical protein
MAPKLLSPDGAREWLRRRYRSQHRAWLGGGGAWPLSVPLGEPSERSVVDDVPAVRQWVDEWARWSDGGEVQWVERQWPRLGTQRLPSRLVVASAADVAGVVGERPRFERALRRHARLEQCWTAIHVSPLVLRHFDELADYTDEDFERLFAAITWLDRNRASGHYLRQLPIEGLDTKWCDASRRALIADLLLAIRGLHHSGDFHDLCGLSRPFRRLRVRLLCPSLRHTVGGLCDIEAPVEEIAALPIQPECTLILENLETGIALPDMTGCAAFMKLGNGVRVLERVPWICPTRAFYWGDLDTHGFAILSQARAALPALTSVLMDETTLLRHRSLWGREVTPYLGADVPHLTADERSVYENLRGNLWGQAVRLEQERIPWAYALAVVRNTLLG